MPSYLCTLFIITNHANQIFTKKSDYVMKSIFFDRKENNYVVEISITINYL